MRTRGGDRAQFARAPTGAFVSALQERRPDDRAVHDTPCVTPPPVVFVPIPPHTPPQPGRSMLNYIWAGLIITSFVFALGYDVRDISADKYRNGQPLPVELTYPEG